MARRGRKRNPNAKRHQKTRILRQPPDFGTPELRAHKELLTGAGDPAHSTTPLTVLYARGLLTEPQMRAGTLFMVGHWAMYGKPFPSSGKYEQTIPSTIDSDSYQTSPSIEHRREVFLSAERCLMDAGQFISMITKNLTAFHEDPKPTAIADIRLGLNALAGAYQCE